MASRVLPLPNRPVIGNMIANNGKYHLDTTKWQCYLSNTRKESSKIEDPSKY
jgi:hypothetical protein